MIKIIFGPKLQQKASFVSMFSSWKKPNCLNRYFIVDKKGAEEIFNAGFNHGMSLEREGCEEYATPNFKKWLKEQLKEQ